MPAFPCHAYAYGDVLKLRIQMKRERIEALSIFQSRLRNGSFLNGQVINQVEPGELDTFRDASAKHGSGGE